MTRRSFAEVEAEAVARERLGVKRHAAEHARRVEAALAKGAIGAEEATLTQQHIAAFAGEVATGLHLDDDDGDDGPVTRAAVRRALGEDGHG